MVDEIHQPHALGMNEEEGQERLAVLEAEIEMLAKLRKPRLECRVRVIIHVVELKIGAEGLMVEGGTFVGQVERPRVPTEAVERRSGGIGINVRQLQQGRGAQGVRA